VRKLFNEVTDMAVVTFLAVMPLFIIFVFIYGIFCIFSTKACAEYIGRISRNPFYADSCSNQFSECGNQFSPNSPKNQFGPYGNPFSPYSAGEFGRGLRVYGDAAPDPAGEGAGAVDDYAAEGGYQ